MVGTVVQHRVIAATSAHWNAIEAALAERNRKTKIAVVQAEASIMKTISVDSNTLHTVTYDAGRQLLQIEFQNGSVYQYFDVPAAVYRELMQASSKGSYFNRSIRPRFDYALVKPASFSWKG